MRACLGTDRSHPIPDDPRILAGQNVQMLMETADQRCSEPTIRWSSIPFSTGAHVPSEISTRTGFYVLLCSTDTRSLIWPGRHDIDDFHLDQITSAQLAIDCHVEQREVAMVLGKFKSKSDCPYILWLWRAFLTDNATLVPCRAKCANGWQVWCFHN